MKIYALTPIGAQVKGSEIRVLLERISDDHPHGVYTPDGCMMKFMSGEWTCWTIGDNEEDIQAIAATNVYHDMIGCQVARIIFLVGRTGGAEGMRDIMSQFETLCEKAGIGNIETMGRKGLSRVLDDFDNEYTVLRKQLKSVNYPQYVVRPEDIVPNTTEIGRA